MNTFIVTEKPLFLYSGVIGLSAGQYGARKAALKPLKKKGQYEILSEVCFKVGEEIGFDGPVIKTFRTNLVPAKEYAERGAEAAHVEVDIENYKKMQSASEDLIKRHAALEQKLAESRLKNEQNEAFILELENALEDMNKTGKDPSGKNDVPGNG